MLGRARLPIRGLAAQLDNWLRAASFSSFILLKLRVITGGNSIQMEELYSTEGDYGLRTLSEPDEAIVEYMTLIIKLGCTKLSPTGIY